MLATWPRRIALILVVIVAVSVVVFIKTQSPEAQVSLGTLAKLSPDQVGAFLRDHPDLDEQLDNSAPGDMASWWKEQSEADKANLLEIAPEFIGNLDGVDYDTRDLANRTHLVDLATKAEKASLKKPTDPKSISQYAALKGILGALEAKSEPERYLINLTDDQPPLAAIAIGDLDSARVVTFAVPGMGTFTNDMQLWTQSAQNIYDTQGLVGADAQRAVVSWIGYKAPPPGIDATLGAYAPRGAPLLADDIGGLTAARDSVGSGAPVINVVAYSYGTTTAANALRDNDLGVYAFVMVGSAGLEKDIKNASALNAEHVYAGEAAKDPEARWGRLSRQDPREAAFGATVFDVDGKADLGLLAVTGHEAILHSEWNDDPLSSAYSKIKDSKTLQEKYEDHLTTYGYLDSGTESLLNVALATTPSAEKELISKR